jgi:hypothetical protein
MGQEMSIPDFIGTEITFERNTVKIRKHLSEGPFRSFACFCCFPVDNILFFSGGLGHVFLVEDMVTGQEYALKRMCTARDNVEMQNLAHTELQLNVRRSFDFGIFFYVCLRLMLFGCCFRETCHRTRISFVTSAAARLFVRMATLSI